ncbi:MAG: tRNA pseudouridine(38-40) synthase TruA [Rhizobiaceae bacterium]
MPRYRITVEYDGTGYAGWQLQAGQHTVQAAIEQAIEAFSGEAARLGVAGRTDAGVHALGQVAHFDLSRDWPASTVFNAVNAKLRQADEPVAILQAERVSDDFNARFSARARHYVYRIVNREAPVAIDRHRAWWVKHRLDEQAMQIAADRLLGTHDFTTFRSVRCQSKSPVKTLDRLDVTRCGDLVEIRASARSFLHNQVRSLTGTLKMAGEGSWSADDVAAALEARDRAACAALAPPCGLYLVKVDYDEGGATPTP